MSTSHKPMPPVGERPRQLHVRILARIQGFLYQTDHKLWWFGHEYTSNVRVLRAIDDLGHFLWRIANALGPDDGP